MRITLIGSGNVATHLGAAFKNAGHKIVQVYSPSLRHASMLAYHVGAQAIDKFEEINTETDVFIISVKDDAIPAVAMQLAGYQKPVVHTSGATPLSVLTEYLPQAGVMYPLQTFNKTREIDFWNVPLCIEASTETLTQNLTLLAGTVSHRVYPINSGQRSILHLAAVFACNFPNYLYYLAHQLLQQQHLQFELIRPLIDETAKKVQYYFPAHVQTGPAVRNDGQTMQAHLELLQHNPDMQKIYEMLSQGIIKMASH